MNQPTDLDLPALAALLAVIDSGSFTLAARTLGVSQPSVSLAIRRLEERVGTPLVVRTRKRVTASRPGETLAAGARLAFEALGSSISRMADEQSEPAGRVVLGCHESLAAYALSAFMAWFLRAYPKVELRLWNGTSRRVHDELVDGRAASSTRPPRCRRSPSSMCRSCSRARTSCASWRSGGSPPRARCPAPASSW